MSDEILIDGSTIRRLRQERGWNAQELAERAGISMAYVYDIEKGKANPSMQVLSRISNVLDVPLADLLFDWEELMDMPSPKTLLVDNFESLAEFLRSFAEGDDNAKHVATLLKTICDTNPMKIIFEGAEQLTINPNQLLRDAIIHLYSLYLSKYQKPNGED